MHRQFFPALLSTAALLLLAAPTLTSAQASRKPSASSAAVTRLASLRQAVAGPERSAENRLRDRYRHPVETLNFFEVDPSDTVVEIWPGRGWYTEVLAPYLKAGGGKLYVGAPGRTGFDKLKATKPALFANVAAAEFPAIDAAATRVPAGSADVVLTFRNVHNWKMGAGRPDKQDYSADAFRQMFGMLKPGGVLGVVDHRLPESASAERERTSGYMKVSTVRRLAEAAGFRLAASSQVNANPRDTADWPEGVWTLPPSLALKDKDRARYVAIGESDRMTLKFVKPR